MKNAIAPLAAGTAVVVIAALLAARPHAPRGSAVEVIAGIGASGSERRAEATGGTVMGRSIAALAKLAVRLDCNRDHLTVFRVDREAREFYDQTAPESREKFQWLLINETKPAPRSGSFPASFWTRVAKRAQSAKRPVAICLFQDGDNDDLRPAARLEMQHAARVLAANPRVVSVRFYGARSKNWDTLRAVFAPLGQRLHFQGPDQINVTPLTQELEAARLQSSPSLAQSQRSSVW